MALPIKTFVRCVNCGNTSPLISRFLGLCPQCIRRDFDKVLPHIEEVHRQARIAFSLPEKPPKGEGVQCQICVNNCSIPLNEVGFCGLRANKGGKLEGANADRAKVSWYYDPLPTNCVADWVCPGGVGSGFPTFAYRPTAEYGYKNLAVFYEACSFNCLFCQNWHFRLSRGRWVSAEELASQVDERTSCICYFGGDPSPQLPHAIRTSRLALEKNKGRILRICFETNGSMHPSLLKKAAELSLNSGGCIKFDLKAWSEEMNFALCGLSNKRTLENFASLVPYTKERPSPPFLIASTLLIPGYIDKEEISGIAGFIASLNPEIPYALLAFAPQFLMTDLPTTSRRHAEEALSIAKYKGLKKVRIGNIHLLSNSY